jgi:hypothetical protein
MIDKLNKNVSFLKTNMKEVVRKSIGDHQVFSKSIIL